MIPLYVLLIVLSKVQAPWAASLFAADLCAPYWLTRFPEKDEKSISAAFQQKNN